MLIQQETASVPKGFSCVSPFFLAFLRIAFYWGCPEWGKLGIREAEKDNAEVRITDPDQSAQTCLLMLFAMALSCFRQVTLCGGSTAAGCWTSWTSDSPRSKKSCLIDHRYQSIVDAEWSIIYEKLDLIATSGANVA